MQTQTLMPGRCGGQKAASPGLKVEDCHAHSMRPSQQGSSRNPHVVNAQKGCMLCVCDEDEEKVLRTSDHKKNYKIAAALRTHIKKANLQPLKRSLDLEQTDENAKKKRNTTTAIHVAKEKKKKKQSVEEEKNKKNICQTAIRQVSSGILKYFRGETFTKRTGTWNANTIKPQPKLLITQNSNCI